MKLDSLYHVNFVISLLWWRANARNFIQHTLYSAQHIHINLTLIHWYMYIVCFTATPTQAKTSSHRVAYKSAIFVCSFLYVYCAPVYKCILNYPDFLIHLLYTCVLSSDSFNPLVISVDNRLVKRWNTREPLGTHVRSFERADPIRSRNLTRKPQ